MTFRYFVRIDVMGRPTLGDYFDAAGPADARAQALALFLAPLTDGIEDLPADEQAILTKMEARLAPLRELPRSIHVRRSSAR